MLKSSQICSMGASQARLCVLWRVPIIHRPHHYFLAQCSVLDSLDFLHPIFGRVQCSWRMEFGFQDQDILMCLLLLGRPCSQTLFVNRAGEYMHVMDIYSHICLFSKNDNLVSVSPIPIWHHRVHSNFFIVVTAFSDHEKSCSHYL